MPQVERLKLIVAYDGTPFRGWQSQRGGNTVQDHLESALADLCGGTIRIHGAGRTDAGVHALAQVAHCDVPEGRLPITQWTAALNARLPAEIRIARVLRTTPRFHARFDAKGKVYTYRIWNAPVPSPFERHRAWHLHGELDIAAMRAAASHFSGRHDFAGFSANRGAPVADTARTLLPTKIRGAGSLITLRFEGDGFLYKMVRLLTGSLVRVAQHRADAEWLQRLLERKGREKTSFAAPAEGLYLTRVRY